MRIAIVGTGPMGLYSFQSLIGSKTPLSITLYEMGEAVGVGMPYSSETASKSMLANIASIEIPPLTETYLAWMQRQPLRKLESYGLDPQELDERSFTPRLLLGEYFFDQMARLIRQASANGHRITPYPRCQVTDVIPMGTSFTLKSDPPTDEAPFDKVILATGHVFEEDDDLTDHYFPNPWSGLLSVPIPEVEVGIMGTSLSAIDAAMAVACQHGRFIGKGEGLRYQTASQGKLMITLMSWTGILPEADFYCPLPYEPLTVMTPDALQAAGRAPQPLQALFALFKAELSKADPDWAAQIDLEGLDLQGFRQAYFHDRATHDPFDWAARNLAEVEANREARHTVPWRYAILRMHEAVESQLQSLSPEEHELFEATLKKVFVDNYAAVPSESIRRLLALHRAGILTILPLGEDYDISHSRDKTVIKANGRTHVFRIFIDARGQKPLTTKDLPFPSLRASLLGKGQTTPQIGKDFALKGYEGRLYLAALPFLMRDHPFVQGITACADIAKVIGP